MSALGLPVIQEAPIVDDAPGGNQRPQNGRHSGRSVAENSRVGTAARISQHLSGDIWPRPKRSWLENGSAASSTSQAMSSRSRSTRRSRATFDAKVGDELVFDVQGVPIKTRIASLREIDWKRFQTNFFVVFPAGVLETAPTFNVLVSRVAGCGGFRAFAKRGGGEVLQCLRARSDFGHPDGGFHSDAKWRSSFG